MLACHQLSRFFPVPLPHRQCQRVYGHEEDDAAEVGGCRRIGSQETTSSHNARRRPTPSGFLLAVIVSQAALSSRWVRALCRPSALFTFGILGPQKMQ